MESGSQEKKFNGQGQQAGSDIQAHAQKPGDLFSNSRVAGDVVAPDQVQSLQHSLSLTLKPPGGKRRIPRWGMGHTVETLEGTNGKGRTRTRGLGLGLCPIK